MTAPSVRPSARSVQPDPDELAHLHRGNCTGGAGCIAACGYRWDRPTVVVLAGEQPHQRYCAGCVEWLVYGGGIRCAGTRVTAA